MRKSRHPLLHRGGLGGIQSWLLRSTPPLGMPSHRCLTRNEGHLKSIHTALLFLSNVGTGRMIRHVRGRSPPSARNCHQGIHTMALGRRSLTFIRIHHCQSCFRNRFRILPAIPPLLALFALLLIGEMIITPVIHFRGPRWSSVLIKGCNGRWKLNRKRGEDGS